MTTHTEKSTATQPVWAAEDYHDLAIAQYESSMKLFSKLGLTGSEKILDVGCGDGKISQVLAKLVPNGHVLAVDKSKEMIDFASKRFASSEQSNLNFMIQDAQQLQFVSRFDLLFSSFALQWVPCKDSFLKGAYMGLKDNSRLGLIVPLTTSVALDQAFESVSLRYEWETYFKHFHPNWYFLDASKYEELVKKNSFEIEHFCESVQEVSFNSRSEFEKYILLWLPYLQPLPEELKQAFFTSLVDKYLEILPMDEKGRVRMKIPTVEILARKTMLSNSQVG